MLAAVLKVGSVDEARGSCPLRLSLAAARRPLRARREKKSSLHAIHPGPRTGLRDEQSYSSVG